MRAHTTSTRGSSRPHKLREPPYPNIHVHITHCLRTTQLRHSSKVRSQDPSSSVIELDHVRQRLRRVAHLPQDEVVERRRVLDARVERLKVPQVRERADQRARRVGGALARPVEALLHDARRHPRRDQPRGHAAAEAVEAERVVLARGRGLGVGAVVGPRRGRRRHVVVEAARLVEGQHPQRLVPLGARAQRLVDALEVRLAVADEPRRVHRVGAHAAAVGRQVGEVRERAGRRVGVELVDADDVARLVVVDRPCVVRGVLHCDVWGQSLPLIDVTRVKSGLDRYISGVGVCLRAVSPSRILKI